MAQVEIEEVVDHLKSEMRRALKDAVAEICPGVHYSEYDLYRAFKRQVRRKCNTWENVPDHYVRT